MAEVSIARVIENDDPESTSRNELIRLIRDLEPGRSLQEGDDQIPLDVLRQLILHTVWLAEEVRVLQQEIDRLNDEEA